MCYIFVQKLKTVLLLYINKKTFKYYDTSKSLERQRNTLF